MSSPPDLHVQALRYKLRPNEQVSYKNPPAVEFQTSEARFKLEDGELTCEMLVHFSDAEAARAVVEPVIRAWELHAELELNRNELLFDFLTASVIDRSPQ